MPVFGRYEGIRELHSGVVSVWAARQAGTQDEPRFAVKTCRPPVFIIGAAEAARATELFLDQARAQQKIAQQGGGRWLEVLDLGSDAEGAYCVMPLQPWSAAELIERRTRLTALQLHRIIGDVVAGLKQLRDAAGRVHGNLKPSNVLLSDRDLTTAKALLSAPRAPRALGAAHTEAADLRALGALILGLITHQTSAAADVHATSADEHWRRLGPASQSWRTLCAQLLGETPSEEPLTLDAVQARIAQLQPKTSRRRPLIAAFAAAILLLAAGAAYFLMDAQRERLVERDPVQQAQWRQWCLEYEAWFKHLANAVAQAPPPADDPHLAGLWQAVKNETSRLSPWEISKDDSQHIDELANRILTVRIVERMPDALTGLNRIREQFLQWPALLEFDGAGQRLGRLGCAAAEQRFAELKAGFAPPTLETIELAERSGERISASAAALKWNPPVQIRAALDLRATLAAIGAAMDQIDASLAAIAAAQPAHPLLQHAPLLAVEAIRADEPTRLKDEVESCAGLLRDLASAADTWSKAVDHHWFAGKAKVSYRPPLPPTPGDVKEWIELVNSPSYHKPDPNADPRRAWAVEKEYSAQMERVDRLLANANLDADRRAKLQAQREAASRQELQAILNHQQLPWDLEHRDAVMQRVSQFTESMRLLQELAIDAETILAGGREKYFQSVRELQLSASAPIDRLWHDWSGRILDQASEHEIPRVEIDNLKAFLRGLETAVAGDLAPAASPGRLRDGVREALGNRRAASIQQAIALLGPEHSVPPDPAAYWAGVKSDHDAWLAGAAAICNDLDTIEQRLDHAYAIDEADESSRSIRDYVEAVQASAVYADLRTVVEPVTQRVAAIDAAEQLNRDELFELAGRIAEPSLCVAAWLRLGDARMSWPRDASELEVEQRLREGLVRLKESLPPQRHSVIQQALDHEGPLRWLACFERITDAFSASEMETQMRRAADPAVRAAFFGDPAAPLPPWIHFNLRLIAFADELSKLSELDDPEDARGAAALEQFGRDVDDLGLSGTAAQQAQQIVQTLRDSASNRGPRPQETGPAKTGKWSAQLVDRSGRVVTYSWKNHRLTFVLLDDAPAESVYLCTTEVSMSLFADWMTETGAWEVLAGRWQSLKGGSWSGIRGWHWDQGFEPRDHWLQSNAEWDLVDLPGYPAPMTDGTKFGLRDEYGGDPNERHPMHYVPPDVAVFFSHALKCRLPRESEWQSALQKESRRAGASDESAFVSLAKCNIRDQAWLAELDHIRSVVAPSVKLDTKAPDHGVFGCEPGVSDASALNDNVVWFTAVERAGSAASLDQFHHLIGNVAELVWDEPQALMDRLMQDPWDASWFNALRGELRKPASPVKVIGGSGLSSPRDFGVARAYPPIAMSPPAYADVGFRLAFDGAAQLSLAQTMREHVEQVRPFLIAREIGASGSGSSSLGGSP